MYANARSRVRINNSYSDSFSVQVGIHQSSVVSPLLFIVVSVGVHQGSVLNPLLFNVAVEALSREFRTGCPWELLLVYTDDLVLTSESLGGLLDKFRLWKEGLESKGLRVSMGKTKVIYRVHSFHTLKVSGKHPCSVCRKGVASDSIYCDGCSHLVHKRCSNT